MVLFRSTRERRWERWAVGFDEVGVLCFFFLLERLECSNGHNGRSSLEGCHPEALWPSTTCLDRAGKAHFGRVLSIMRMNDSGMDGNGRWADWKRGRLEEDCPVCPSLISFASERSVKETGDSCKGRH